MALVTSLSIVLQHDIDEQYQYQPGEIIRGIIRTTVSKATGIREIEVKVYSEGNVSWKDEKGGHVYQAQEVYVDSAKTVVDTSQALEPLRLSPGQHEFPFDYILPENVPSSYIGKHGNVTYAMKVTVTTANPRETSISSEPFLVLRRSPIPALAQQPLSLTASRRMLCSCSLGKLEVKVGLDRAGGVPGEDLFLLAEVINNTGTPVTAMQASLIMDSIFRAQNRSTDFRQVVSKKRDEDELPPGEGRRWTNVRMPLPPYIPESKLEFCDIIELDYTFQFRVELVGGKEIRLETPFWVGAQPQGLEIPENERLGARINQQWTVRGTHRLSTVGSDAGNNNVNSNGEGGKQDGAHTYSNHGMHGGVMGGIDDHDDDDWGLEKVPELRQDTLVSNPLFLRHQQQQQHQHITRAIPEQLLENTKL